MERSAERNKQMSKLGKIMDGVSEERETKGQTLMERSYTTPSDEYYTTRETVEALEDQFRPVLYERTVICPFDGDNSEFVLVMKEKGYRVINWADDYREHLGEMQALCDQENAIVFSNPPFSIITKIIKDFNKHGINYLMLNNLLKIRASVNNGAKCLYLDSIKYKNGKYVPTMAISNLEIRPFYVAWGQKPPRFIDGKRFYTNVAEWEAAGTPSECYVCSTWAATPHSQFYEWNFEDHPGFFNPVHITKERWNKWT